MKVLFLQNIDGVAGSEKYFLALIPQLIKKGVDVTMYCVIKKQNKSKGQKFIDLLEAQKIPFQIQYCNTYGSLSIPYKINKFVKANQIDIIHTHLIYADFWGAMIKKLFNKKVVIVSTKHGYHETTYVEYCNQPEKLPKNLYYKLFKFTHKNIDFSYACSYGLRDFYEKGGLINKKEMDVIQHGFNYPEISDFDKTKYRFSDIQLIIVGRLIKRKGHHFVFEIMPELIKLYPNIKLIILGDGEMEEELKQQVKSLNIENSVDFLGFKPNVEKYLSASDVAIVPSYSEGLPLVIFEAFNAKVPVVSFNSIGCNELIEHHQTGMLANAFNTDELKQNIIELLENPVKSKQIAQNGYQKLKAYFSLERMTVDTFEFYKSVLNQSLPN